MNAICGILHHAAGVAEGLDAMLAALADDGAEGGRWTEGAVGLGCRRLASAADQAAATPLLHFDRAAGLTLAADARLDDRDALCAALGVPRPERAGLADGDLILRAWSRWGRDCPNHLLGDYAFAVRDARRRILFCARDHAGARPFYHVRTPHGFAFASTVEAVLALPGVADDLDETAVATYLTGSLVTAPRTFFQAVRSLPPGHALTVEEDARAPARLARYWRPENVPRAPPASDDAYAEELLDLFARAVKDRLRGSDPVGTHLSGGFDSSGVAVLAARELRRQGRPPPLAFSWLADLGDGPPDDDFAPEYARVDAVCVQEGLRVLHRAPRPADIVAVLRRDGAFPGVHVHLNEEAVQRSAAARGVRVLLSGFGGDEGASFGGRGYHVHLLLRLRWMRLVAELRARDGSPWKRLAGAVAPVVMMPSFYRKVRRLLKSRGPHHGRRGQRRWLVHPAFVRRARPPPTIWPTGGRSVQLQSLRHGHLNALMEGWAASGARRGIEYRYPLLDRRVLELALGLPPEQFQRGRWGRRLMRHALRSVLPPVVCWQENKAADPARMESLLDAFADALPLVRRALEARAAPPARSGYVDMPRLLEELDADRFRATTPPERMLGPLVVALMILDL